MAQSRLVGQDDEGIGDPPADLDAWDKLQLGWLDYEIVLAGDKRTLELGPHEYNSKKAQGAGGRAAEEAGRPPTSVPRPRAPRPGGAAGRRPQQHA